jgi:hypothetical protein
MVSEDMLYCLAWNLEKRVLDLAAAGLNREEICRELFPANHDLPVGRPPAQALRVVGRLQAKYNAQKEPQNV